MHLDVPSDVSPFDYLNLNDRVGWQCIIIYAQTAVVEGRAHTARHLHYSYFQRSIGLEHFPDLHLDVDRLVSLCTIGVRTDGWLTL